MKKRRWSEGWMPVWLLLLSLPVAGQDSFHYRAEVDTPNASDFYRLLLSPEFVARSKPDLSDVRILGSDGRFVPYVLKHRAADSGAGDQFLPEPVIVQNDSSNRHSYITLTWHQPYLVGGLSLGIGSPTLYKREARVFVEPADGAWSAVSLISIDPRDTVFHFPAVRTRGLRIEVDNADNAPLKIVRFRAMQDCIYLVTWLQTGSSYTLLTGDASAAFPQYDLGYFTDSLTRRPRQIGVGRGQETTIVAGDRSAPAVRSMAKPVGGFVLWSILSTVLLLLIYLSVKMVGAIGAKKEPHDRL